MKLDAYEGTYFSGSGIGNQQQCIFSGQGILRQVVLGTTQATGQVILADGTQSVAVLKTSIVENTYFFDCVIKNGLYITLRGSPTITVLWSK